ncbi:MAG: Smr/MutS family protein [Flavobacteriaceae bacterium]
MKLKEGDRVSAIDELMEGRVIAVVKDRVHVKTRDGFTLEFNQNELIKIDEDLSFDLNTSTPIENILKEKESVKRKNTPIPSKKERNAPAMEVDLHINQLIKSTRGMDNYDMLNLQMDTAKRQLEFAIKNRIQRLVFIHGVGEGVLRTELEFLLNRYDNLKFYDADYQKYGRGATEVYIFQNPK